MAFTFRYFRVPLKVFEENPATIQALIRAAVGAVLHPDDYADPAVLDKETTDIWNAFVSNIVGDHGLFLIENGEPLGDLIRFFIRLGEPVPGDINWRNVTDFPRNLVLYDDLSFDDTVVITDQLVVSDDVVTIIDDQVDDKIVLPEQELVNRIVELRNNISKARTNLVADMAELKNLCEQLAEI